MAERVLIEDEEVLLVLENYALGVQGATVATTSPGPGNLTVDNLLSDALDTAYRTETFKNGTTLLPGWSDGDVVRIRFALNASRDVDTVVLGHHNIRCPYRVLFYNADPAVAPPIYTGAWTDPIVRASFEDFNYYDFSWTLGPSTAKLDSLKAAFELNSIYVTDERVLNATWMDLEFLVTNFDTLALQADYAQLSLVMLAKRFQPRVNVAYGWGLGVEDTSTVRRTEAGAKHGRQRARLKTFACDFGNLRPRPQVFDVLMAHMEDDGRGQLGRIFAWPEPRQRRYFYRQSFIGTAEEMGDVQLSYFDMFTSSGWMFMETK